MDFCRDRYGEFAPAVFNLWTCAMCYHYLFQDKKDLRVNLPNGHRLEALNSSVFLHGEVIYPDITNDTIRAAVCSTLGDEECDRWQKCCFAAISCCEEQILQQRYLPEPSDYCPKTWDGFSCVDEVFRDSTVYFACPTYISQGSPGGRAKKKCDKNGTWYKKPQTGLEWTDYTSCVNLENFRVLFYVTVICNVLSFALLLPACVIFLWYRQLRKQYRVRIHVNLFVSFILRNVVLVLWENLVNNNRLQNTAADTLMHQNTVGCKLLYILTRYSLAATFSWMFLEGFHLYRLTVRAFKVPRSIFGYYIGGWVCPLIPVFIYTIIRMRRRDEGCWVVNAGLYEWIVYVPNLICILMNVFFLFAIMRILLGQLQIHPSEPSNFRRALKASFILLPLFGLQLFLVIYRPPQQSHSSYPYEVAAEIITNAQGAVVAVLLCYLNNEVHSQLNIGFFNKDARFHLNFLRECKRAEDNEDHRCYNKSTIFSKRLEQRF